MKSKILFVLLFATLCFSRGFAEEPLKILVFGNSYSHCVIEDLPEFAKAAGERPVEVVCLRIAGLDKHWKAIEAGEQDPASDKAKVALETDYKAKVASAETIKNTKWDVIVLQQISVQSPDAKTYMPYAKKIYDYCKQHNPGARVVFYQTHAYRDDSIKYKGSANKNFREPYSEDEMHKDVRASVLSSAKALGIEVVPVGDAFQLARKSPLWGYSFPDPNFDYETAEPPATPNEKNSLHIGFKWGKEVRKTGRCIRSIVIRTISDAILAVRFFTKCFSGKARKTSPTSPRRKKEAANPIWMRIKDLRQKEPPHCGKSPTRRSRHSGKNSPTSNPEQSCGRNPRTRSNFIYKDLNKSTWNIA